MVEAPRGWRHILQFDWLAVALSVALAAAVCLPTWANLTDQREEYYFDVVLTASASGQTRLYWDKGRGFNEHDSSVQPLRATAVPATYRYLLPYGSVRALRLAVVDHPADVTVRAARIGGPRKHVLHRFSPEDLQSTGSGVSLRREAEIVSATITGDPNSGIDVRLPERLELPITTRARLRSAPALAWIALAVGLSLAAPFRALRGMVRGFSAWAVARPLTCLALTSAAAVLWQTHPVVFGGRSFVSPGNGSLMLYGDLPTVPGMHQKEYTDGMASDIGAMLFQHLYYPMVERDALAHGELPLWNRWSLCGVPLLGQGQSMAADPLNLLTIVTDSASWAWDLRFVFSRWLLACGLGIAAWQLTRHLPSAALTAVGASFLGLFTYRLNHPANFSVAYAPWLLVAWLALAAARNERRVGLALLLLFAAHWLEFASGTMKEAVVLIVASDLAGCGILLSTPESYGQRWRRVIAAAAVGVVFLLASAPLWWSFLDALRHSHTSYDAPHADQLPFRQLIGFFDDMFYRETTREEWVVAPAVNALFFVGALAWVCLPRFPGAAAALGRPGSKRLVAAAAEQPATSFLICLPRAGVALASVCALCGAVAFDVVPARWLVHVPFVANIGHVGDVFSCALLVLVPPLSAIGFYRAAQLRDIGVAVRRAPIAIVGVAVLVVSAMNYRHAAFSAFFRAYTLQLAIGTAAVVIGWIAAVGGRPATWRVACALAVPLLLWRHGQYLRSEFNHYVFVPGERVDVHAGEASAAVQRIDRERTTPARVVGLEGNLFPAFNAALHWESLYGVDAVRNRWYDELASAAGLQRVWRWDEPEADRVFTVLRPFRDALGVRWYLADKSDAPRPFDGVTRTAALDLDVYESPAAWPRAFFTDRLGRYRSADDFVALVRREWRQPFAAIQEDQPEAKAPGDDLAHRVVVPATNYRLTANTTRFTVDAPGAGVVVLTEAFYPNDFDVRVNGERVPYFRVNHAFKAVAIPRAGKYEVTFAYWPAHFGWALAAGGLGWLGVLIGASALMFGLRSAPPHAAL